MQNKAHNEMPPLDEIEEALTRVDRQLRDTVRVVLSPAAWDTYQPEDPEKHYVHPTGPEWEGLPGTHPLLRFVRSALVAVKKLKEAK